MPDSYLLPGLKLVVPYPITTQLFDLRAILSFCLVDKLGSGRTAMVVKLNGSSVIISAMSCITINAPLNRNPGC